MKNKTSIALVLTASIFAIAFYGFNSFEQPVMGAPSLIYQKTILPEIDSTYELGTSSKAWLRATVDEVCLTGDSCKIAWPISNAISTSSPLVAGQSVYATAWNTIASAANLLWNNTTSLLTVNGNASTTQLTTTGSTYLAIGGGNVGIGTNNPTRTFDVVGNANIAGIFSVTKDAGYVAPDQIQLTGSTNPNQQLLLGYNTASNYGAIQAILQGTGAKPLVLNEIGGNVGIGVVSPQAKLDVLGPGTSGSTALLLRNGDTGNGSGNTTQIRMGYADSDEYQHYISTWHSGAAANNSINFYTSDGTATGVFPTNAVLGMSIRNGLVGIGTTNPISYANLQVGNGTGSKILAINGGDSGSNNGNAIYFMNADATKLAIGSYSNIFGGSFDSTPTIYTTTNIAIPLGSVGIGMGTTTPDSKLQVYDEIYGGSLDVGSLANLGATINLTPFRSGLGTGYRWQMIARPAGQSYRFDIGAGGNPYITILNNAVAGAGQVGINTVAPNAQLEIGGASQTTAALTDAGSKQSSIMLSDNTTGDAGSGGAVLFAGATANGVRAQASIKSLLTNGNGNGIGDLAFSTRNATADTALTERMRILANGYVGIGLSSPGTTLDLGTAVIGEAQRFSYSADPTYYNYISTRYSGGADAENYLAFNIGTAAQAHNEVIRFNGAGNVGIGTTSPVSKLEVYNGDLTLNNTSAGVPAVSYTEAGDQKAFVQYVGSGTGVTGRAGYLEIGAVGVNSLGGIAFRGNAEYMRLVTVGTGVGNLGIGTTTPLAHLDISGSAGAGQFNSAIRFTETSGSADSRNWAIGSGAGLLYGALSFMNSSASGGVSTVERMTLDKAGNLGIGSSTPYAKLSVDGAVVANGNATFGATSATASSTIIMKTLQFEGQDSGGTVRCTFLNASGAWVVITGACNQ